MKFLALFIAAAGIALGTNAVGGCGEPANDAALSPSPRTFAMETFIGRSYNYLDNMTDRDGLPYFNIFWTEPAEAAHDWPDFGDVMSRQWQGAVMARHATGKEARNEKIWSKKSLSYFDPKTGLLVRPKTNFSDLVADRGDQALTLYTLATAYADSKDPKLKEAIQIMVDHLADPNQPGEPFGGFIIKSLMTCVRQTGYRPALDLARRITEKLFREDTPFTHDNRFHQGAHVHGSLRSLVGAADFALYVNDPVLFSRVDALYRDMRSQGTRFGFIPEVIGRQGDIVSCETCALMDYAGLAVTLANNGHPEYWGDVERLARNQLVESQMVDGSWLHSAADKPDTHQFSWRDIGSRMVGGYAGWSSPTHLLAAREVLHWGGPELQNKTRAFQNCCGGSGTHALFIIWKNASRFDNGTLSVNLHIDKLLPQAEVRGYQPYKGLLTVDLKTDSRVRVRIPEFVVPSQMKVHSSSGNEKSAVWGNYLDLGERKSGEKLEISYPLPIREEEEVIGNPGFRHYRYRVTWKGDTVVRITPIGGQVEKAYSDFDQKQVEVFYGKDGPAPLYQRENMLKDAAPAKSPLHEDDGSLDFWYLHNP